MSDRDELLAIGLETARENAGESIVYHRSATELTVTAIKGRRLSELMPLASAYAQTQVENTDWLFAASALVSLTPATPVVSDWVEWGGNKYQLAAAEDGKHWRWVDPAQTWIRVHTVHAGVV